MKLPVVFSLGNRQASLDKDELMKNALAEIDESGPRARKRPCIDSAYEATAALGQGLFNWNIPGMEILVVITGDDLNTAPDPLSKSLQFFVEPE